MADKVGFSLNTGVLKWLLSIFIFVVIVSYILPRSELLNVAKGVNLYSIAILSVLASFSLFSNSIILKMLLSSFNVHIPVVESFAVSSFNALGNYLTALGGGTLSKAVYLKKRYDFSYSAFVASMSATHIVDLLMVSLLGCIVLVYVSGLVMLWGKVLFIGFLFLGILTFCLLVLPLALPPFAGRIFNALRDIIDGWSMLKKRRRLLVQLSMLLLINHLLFALEFLVGYEAFSLKIGIADAVLIGVLSSLSTIIKITPANLGVQEGVIAFSSQLLGAGFGEGLLVAGLLRMVSVVLFSFYGGLLGFYIIKKKYRVQ